LNLAEKWRILVEVVIYGTIGVSICTSMGIELAGSFFPNSGSFDESRIETKDIQSEWAKQYSSPEPIEGEFLLLLSLPSGIYEDETRSDPQSRIGID
jgi:hypothetical protein